MVRTAGTAVECMLVPALDQRQVVMVTPISTAGKPCLEMAHLLLRHDHEECTLRLSMALSLHAGKFGATLP